MEPSKWLYQLYWWSSYSLVDQVAVDRTTPNGRVIGIDVIPAQPPKGVSTIQGNFLSQSIQASVRQFVQDPQKGRPALPSLGGLNIDRHEKASEKSVTTHSATDTYGPDVIGRIPISKSGPIDDEGKTWEDCSSDATVDVVLSDMSAPWEQSFQSSSRSLINPYARMMNTSGNSLRDHVGSMVSVWPFVTNSGSRSSRICATLPWDLHSTLWNLVALFSASSIRETKIKFSKVVWNASSSKFREKNPNHQEV